MAERIDRSWENLLNPEHMREGLLEASMFIAAFETLKASIIDRIRGFFISGFNEDGWIVNERYATDVVAKHKSILHASLLWLQDMGAIDGDDLKTFYEIRAIRNEMTHEMIQVIFDGRADQAEHFQRMVDLLRKIEVWWIQNVEILTNPDFDGQEIDEAEITPGPIILIHWMKQVARGEALDENMN